MPPAALSSRHGLKPLKATFRSASRRLSVPPSLCAVAHFSLEELPLNSAKDRAIVRFARSEQKANEKGRHSMDTQRQLKDLISIGPAMLKDFEQLGIKSVPQLAKQQPMKMYQRLQRLRGQPMDICVLDTFDAAVAQARNPRLPAEKCQWWYWSRKRKSSAAKR
jgi:Pathogenicity locus